ncbi:MAG: permease, partial [Moritella sp.]|uniref:permease n=1 Tax=Moritella sp. TaxID=78556 RepID=UPI001D1D2FD1
MFNITQAMVMDTFGMFAFLAAELTVLFLLISYLVGVLQEYIPPAKIQSILSGKNGKGYIVAGLLGAITPFCSCSTIPFLNGLLRAKAGFGPMMVFLFASPLLNPIIIGLFAVTFGMKVTVFYFTIAMGVSVIAGYTLEKLGFETYVKPQAYIEPEAKGCASACGGNQAPLSKWMKIWHSTWADFKKVLPYFIVCIALCSMIYVFMPTEFVARIASEDNPFAIPVAAVIGIPLYIRAEAVIPLSAALAAKGMSLGAVMALI